MGWLDRLREGLEEALAAEQAAALREDAGAAPRPPAPEEEAWRSADAAPRPAEEPWPPPDAAPGPSRRRPPPSADGGASADGAPLPAAAGERRRSLPARLRDPGVLRDAFVMKEILDRPISLRRGRDRLRP